MRASVLYCRVPWLCCVTGRGKDAYDFLHRQLTSDPPAEDYRFVLAAWNDAKGRVRALLRLLRGDEGPLLIAERDGLEAMLAKLRIFVLRSDVELTPRPDLTVGAVIGDAGSLLESRGLALGADRGSLTRADGVLWLRQSGELIHVVGPAAELERLDSELAPATSEHAARAEIAAGLPYLGSALAERYVPQMLNLDRLDGIAFDKGCYPGQEIVARLHHLGSVKRRMRRFVADGIAVAPPPGAPVLDAAGKEVGDVLRSVTVEGTLDLLAVVQLDAARNALFVGEERVPLRPAGLPQDDPND